MIPELARAVHYCTCVEGPVARGRMAQGEQVITLNTPKVEQLVFWGFATYATFLSVDTKTSLTTSSGLQSQE